MHQTPTEFRFLYQLNLHEHIKSSYVQALPLSSQIMYEKIMIAPPNMNIRPKYIYLIIGLF